ncbi:MAG: hypothetical protein CFE32_13060 [Alphaproteobacteria bacterium PA3]|nr:MAG: hypothetical protein CFE32_13060 [Alphaproteobacteria bacterium PA3]
MPPLTLMLANALEQTLANPSASHRWHTLGALYMAQVSADQQAYVCDALLRGVPGTGEVGFFRATFLAEYTKNAQYSAQAGLILQSVSPFDADRHMAFCVYEWGRQALGQGSRPQGADALRLALVPESMQRIGQALALPDGLFGVAARQGALRRVAIVAPYISGYQHPPSMLALQHARLLAASGIEAHVFSAQELRVNHMADYLGSKGQIHLAAPTLEELQPHLADGVGLTLCDERFSVLRRCQDVLQAVAAFAPDAVIFVGMMSPLMAPISAAVPTLGLCVHALQPMAAVDAWLTSDPTQHGQWSQSWGPSLPPSQAIYHPYRVALKPCTQTARRADLDLTPDALVLITAGARLAYEVEGDWAARMLHWLHHHSQAVWLLVGGDASVPPALRLAMDTGALRILPHQSDLRGLLRYADIYANPPRLGGGFSVAEAMAEGLAVASMANGDGGDKVGPTATSTLDDYFAQLSAWAAHANARKAAGQALQQRFEATLNLDRSGPSLLAALHTVQALFAQRSVSAPAAR